MNLYKLINTRMSAKPPGTITWTSDSTRPFTHNNAFHAGVYYDLVDNPLTAYQGDLECYPIKLLKEFIISELTLYESLLPSLEPAVKGAPQRDQGYVWSYLVLAAVSQDRVKQVLEHVRDPLQEECERLRGVEGGEGDEGDESHEGDDGVKEWSERRAKEWEECIRELEQVVVLQGRAMQAFGENWVARETKMAAKGEEEVKEEKQGEVEEEAKAKGQTPVKGQTQSKKDTKVKKEKKAGVKRGRKAKI